LTRAAKFDETTNAAGLVSAVLAARIPAKPAGLLAVAGIAAAANGGRTAGD